MIKITRTDLEPDLADKLRRRTARLLADGANDTAARRRWHKAAAERARIREALCGMCAAIERCMYCGDSRGTDIDHFEPISRAPARTFDWSNHLLACSSCNSNAKRDQFPCDENGECLLVDPTTDDPYDHLRLTLSTGTYNPLTPKGEATIRVFQLNRPDLRRGREIAFPRSQAMLRDYLRMRKDGDEHSAEHMLAALRQQPFADVLFAMYRTLPRTGAALVLGGPEVVEALQLSLA
jgi:HNH endonuclease.